MEAEIHRYPFVVLEQYLDTFGHMNNADYLVVYEAARWDFITKNGFGLKEVQETQTGPVILETTVRFQKEIRLREEITVISQVTSWKKMIQSVHQEMVNAKGEVCSTADFKFGLFDMKTRRLIPATSYWLKALGVTI